MSVKQSAGLQLASGPLMQKTGAPGVYRQQFSVTRTRRIPSTLRVLVTMDMAEGTGFGFFTDSRSQAEPMLRNRIQ